MHDRNQVPAELFPYRNGGITAGLSGLTTTEHSGRPCSQCEGPNRGQNLKVQFKALGEGQGHCLMSYLGRFLG